MINIWTQNDHFNDARDVILLLRTDVSVMVDDDYVHEWPLVVQIQRLIYSELSTPFSRAN